MDSVDLLRLFEEITLLSLVKLVFVVGILVYTVFAFLMLRQIQVMSRVVMMKYDYVIKIIGVAHSVFALMVLLVALVIL